MRKRRNDTAGPERYDHHAPRHPLNRSFDRDLHRSTKLTKLVVYAIAIDWRHRKGSQPRSRIAVMTLLPDWRLKPLTISSSASRLPPPVQPRSDPRATTPPQGSTT